LTLKEYYPDHLYIYTDGSATPGDSRSVGVGMVVDQTKIGKRWRIDPDHSFLAAEVFGILQTLIYGRTTSHRTVLVLTDSLSSLQLLQSSILRSYGHLVNQINTNLLEFQTGEVIFRSVPAPG
jgi:ribonuclease HI